MVLFGMGREAMARGLGQVAAHLAAAAENRAWSKDDPYDPMPLPTVDDYIRRVNDRWEKNPLPNRIQARERAIRRNHSHLRTLIIREDYPNIIDVEKHLSKIEGTEFPKHVEVSSPGGGPVQYQQVDELGRALDKLAGRKA